MSEYDVVILVADSHAEVFVDVLLKEKREAIGVGPIRYEVIVHYERSGGIQEPVRASTGLSGQGEEGPGDVGRGVERFPG